MASNNDHSMEKLLRRYAERRRAAPGASQELHPATRRLLQSEVKRQYPSLNPGNSKRPSVAWWFRWPGLVAVGSSTVILCLGLIWWAHDHSSSRLEMARNEARDRVPPTSSSKIQSESLAEKSERPSREFQALKRLDQGFSKDQAAPTASAPKPLAPPANIAPMVARSEPPAPSPAVPMQTRDTSVMLEDRKSQASAGKKISAVAKESALAAAPSAPSGSAAPAAAAPVNLTMTSAGAAGASADASQNNLLQQRMLFQRTDAKPSTRLETARAKTASAEKSKPSPATPNLLSTFEFRYADGIAQVIDQDGSVYQGTFTGVPTPSAPPVTGSDYSRSSSKLIAQSPNTSPPSLYPFQVSGTNRSLRQRVSVTGFLKPSQNAAESAATYLGSLQKQNLSGGTLYGAPWELNATIQLGTNANRLLNANQIGVPQTPPPSGTAPTQRP